MKIIGLYLASVTHGIIVGSYIWGGYSYVLLTVSTVLVTIALFISDEKQNANSTN